MTESHRSGEEEQTPSEDKLGSLPPRLAARIRRQRARKKLQEREAQLHVPPGEEEPSSDDEPSEAPLQEPEEAVEVEALEAEADSAGEPEPGRKVPAAALAAGDPPEAPPAPKVPITGGVADLRARRVPTVTGVVRELWRGAWGAVTGLIESRVRRFKKRRMLDEADRTVLIITEEDLLERRQKVRGYVLASTIIHLLLFLPLINLAMLQEPEKKPPVQVRLLDTPPPAKKIEKRKKKAETEKTTKRTRKVVKARGPRPAPRPVRRPTPKKSYVSPKKMLVAKATQPKVRTPAAPAVPKVEAARLEAVRPRTSLSRLPTEVAAEVTSPTKPLLLPETSPQVTSLAHTVSQQAPKATRPKVLAVDVPIVPDTEGRASRLADSFPKEFLVSDRFAAPTAPPQLPQSRAPAPKVFGQVASVVSESAPESATPLSSKVVAAAEAAGTSTRPVDERRTAQTVEARLGGEVGPEAPQPVSFGDVKEFRPVGSAPAEFQDEITVPLNSDDPRFKEYLAAVKRRILEVWRYPDDAEPGLSGKVNVEFSIERDGSVSRVRIIAASGYVVLDRGAKDAMRRASPFPPLPGDFKTNRLNVVGGFRYN